MKNFNILERIKIKLFGWDLFISYRRSDSYGYVKALEKELSKKIVCFVDESSVGAGRELPKLITKGIKRSKYMLLIASPEAAIPPKANNPDWKDWIEEEVNKFNGTIIPVNIGNSLNQFKNEKLKNRNVVFISEYEGALKNSLPSSHVIDEIKGYFKVNAVNNQANITLLSITFLLTFAALLVIFYWKENKQTHKNQDINKVTELKRQYNQFSKNEGLIHYSEAIANKIRIICINYPNEKECKSFVDSLNTSK